MVKEYKAPKAINAVVRGLNRLGLGRSVTLTTKGKQSGEEREVPVSPIEVDGKTFLVAPYGEVAWVLNARANGDVTLKAGRSSSRHRLVEMLDGRENVVYAYYQRESFPRQYMDVPENPTIEDFRAAADLFPVFEVT